MNPGVRLSVGHENPQFYPILARIVDYYSLFWGPGVISTIDEPRGTFTCQSSKLVLLADSGPFRAQYSLFWCPGVISTIDEPRGAFTCRSSTPTVLADFGPFVDYYSLFWGPGLISTIDEPRGAFMWRSSTPVVFAGSDPFLGLLLTVLGSWIDFHD